MVQTRMLYGPAKRAPRYVVACQAADAARQVANSQRAHKPDSHSTAVTLVVPWELSYVAVR